MVKAYELNQLLTRQAGEARAYLEFLRTESMSMGIYQLSAGSEDPQQPHTEDEVYYVLNGRAQIKVDNEDRPVQAGSIVFVAANVEHRFHSIEEDLTVLVFFAPAEYSQQKQI